MSGRPERTSNDVISVDFNQLIMFKSNDGKRSSKSTTTTKTEFITMPNTKVASTWINQ